MFQQITSKTIFLVALLCSSFIYSMSLHAADIDHFPLITYECDTTKDLLIVTNKLLKGEDKTNFKYSDEEGTYSPWDWVKIKDNKIIDSSSIKKECQLSSAKYTVILEPQIFNPSLDGFCGPVISTAINILADGEEVMERKAFEFHCSGNTKIITGIKVVGKSGEIKTRAVARHKYY